MTLALRTESPALMTTQSNRGRSFELALSRAFLLAASLGWRGLDPYDGLLSPLANLPVLKRRRAWRLAMTQAIKRSALNLRPFLGIRPGVNPKGLALFLSAAARTGSWPDQFMDLASRLERLRASGYAGAGWGYNFPWQGRSFYLPPGTPTVVVTSFAGGAFLDAYEATGEERHLETALEACRFVLESLHRTEDRTGTCLSYSPLDRTAVYNASLLGARLLVRVGMAAGRQDLVDQARPLVTFVLARQDPDGSWRYGEAGFQGWVDSFHTGFVLEALEVYHKATDDPVTEKAIGRGARFYARAFFEADGAPRYYPDRPYPRDIHCSAQGVLTFLGLCDFDPAFHERARDVGRWMVDNMLDPEGCFYYQIRHKRAVRTLFMRWSQAWGVRALAELVRRGIEL